MLKKFLNNFFVSSQNSSLASHVASSTRDRSSSEWEGDLDQPLQLYKDADILNYLLRGAEEIDSSYIYRIDTKVDDSNNVIIKITLKKQNDCRILSNIINSNLLCHQPVSCNASTANIIIVVFKKEALDKIIASSQGEQQPTLRHC